MPKASLTSSSISLEFNRKRDTDHVLKVVKGTISNILNGKRANNRQDAFLVTGFLNGKGKPYSTQNCNMARKGVLIATDGKRRIFAKENFYPIFLEEKGYKNALCMKAVKLKG